MRACFIVRRSSPSWFKCIVVKSSNCQTPVLSEVKIFDVCVCHAKAGQGWGFSRNMFVHCKTRRSVTELTVALSNVARDIFVGKKRRSGWIRRGKKVWKNFMGIWIRQEDENMGGDHRWSPDLQWGTKNIGKNSCDLSLLAQNEDGCLKLVELCDFFHFFLKLVSNFNDCRPILILIDRICLLLASRHLCTAQLCVVELDSDLTGRAVLHFSSDRTVPVSAYRYVANSRF